MDELEIKSGSAEETVRLGKALGRVLEPGNVVLLNGDLGAGKTQFAKGVIEGLGSKTEAVSPTFSIMLEYADGRIPLMHMDLYRLEEAIELEDIDFYSMTDEGSCYACLIEWADLFPEEMPDDVLDVRISRDGTGEDLNTRKIAIEASGAGSHALLASWMQKKELH